MQQTLRFTVLSAALLLLLTLSAPARATTYKMVGDAALADQAAAIAEVRVDDIESAPTEGWPATDYLVSVERLVKGSVPGSSLIVRVPGGRRPGGLGLRIWGAPEFAPGDRALLFLAPNLDGSFHILHLMLGAFHEVQEGGRWLAVRDLSEAHEVGASPEEERRRGERDLARFRSWLADRAAGRLREADYFVSPGGLSSIREPFTFIEHQRMKIRWFEFDQGQSVAWRAHSGGQPGVPGGGFTEFQNAIGAWNADPGSNVNYAYAGQTSATGGLDDFDQINAILFNHGLEEAYDCATGGVLAIGGPWFDPELQGTFNGETYVRAVGADIVTNSGLECFFQTSPDARRAAEELFGHELGHTLGLGHSCGDNRSGLCARNPLWDDALMRATVHDDGRGARLNEDDRAGIRTLYGRSSTPRPPAGPAAPGSLAGTVEGLSILLTWTDRSANEQGFRVYRGTNNGALELVATLPAGTTSYSDTGLDPSTRYDYQVAAFNNQGENRSARISARTPATQPVAVAIEPVSLARTGEPVQLRALFSGPARSARWEISGGGAAFSDAPCAAGAFCAQHIFTHPGTYQVRITVTGDQGQTSESVLALTVEGPEVTLQGRGSFLQSALFAPRGDTGLFKSDVWLHNASLFPVLVRITFLPRGLASPVRRELTLASGTSVFLPNVLSSLFGQTNQQGSLSLEYLAPASAFGAAPQVFTFSRSYADPASPAEGSFGQLVSEEPESTWSAAPKAVAGILEGNGFLSTVLAANLDAIGGQVTIDLRDGDGNRVGPPATFTLGPRNLRFQPISRLFPDVVDHTGPFTALFSSSGIRFAASATLLEVESEDQIFVPAAPTGAGSLTGGEVLIPRVVRNRGQFDTFLVSRLIAFNPSATERRDMAVELWLRGQDNTAPRTALRSVDPGSSLLIEDVLQDLFGLNEGTGALRITWSGGAGPDLRLLSMTFAETQGEGRQFGTLVDSRPPAEAVTRAVDFGAEQTSVSRSAYGVLSLSASPTTVRLTLKSSSGAVLATADVSLRPRQHFERALNGIFSGLGNGSNWVVETEVLSGGPVLTYLANVNVSGDVFYVPGHAR